MIGIRSEDKNRWERRVPLTPDHVAELVRNGIEVRVQPSPIRAFPDEAYRRASARIHEDLSGCQVVFGVKEVPVEKIIPRTTYALFAHVAKGQPHNMPMLRRLMDSGCSVVDYEKIVDHRGRRLIFFGRHAGFAGMIDALHGMGRRLAAEGLSTPFAALRISHDYAELQEAREHLQRVGEDIRRNGLPPSLHPLVVGFAGSGNVIQGALEILSHLPYEDVGPDALDRLSSDPDLPRRTLFRVVLDGADRVERRDGSPYDDAEFLGDPTLFRSTMARHLPHLTVLVNGIYWAPGFPRVATRSELRALWSGREPPRLRIIADISCDIEGSVEATTRVTTPGDPFFVWEPATGETLSGVVGRGPAILAVDNLPCEIPVDASSYFGDALMRFVPALARCDWGRSVGEIDLPAEIVRALVVHRGQLTPGFRYLSTALTASGGVRT